MAEALTQSQIDELLNRMRTGDSAKAVEPEPQSKIKEYDFSSPKKFTKDQLKSLNNLYENYARMISSYFTSVLRSLCEVNVVEIEEQRYYEFNNALPDNVLVSMIDFKPETGDETTMMLELSSSFGYLLIERLMGSTGIPYIPERDYTEIELALLRLVNENLCKYLGEAWDTYVPINTQLRSIETNGRLLQAFSPQDVVVIVSLEIKGSVFTGVANICMPAENLEELINSFSAKYSKTTKQQDPEKEKIRREMVLDYLKQSDLEIQAVLDQCELTLGELVQLQVHDVISLNRKITDNISVTVEGIPWFNARLGETDTKKAIKLVDSIVI